MRIANAHLRRVETFLVEHVDAQTVWLVPTGGASTPQALPCDSIASGFHSGDALLSAPLSQGYITGCAEHAARLTRLTKLRRTTPVTDGETLDAIPYGTLIQ